MSSDTGSVGDPLGEAEGLSVLCLSLPVLDAGNRLLACASQSQHTNHHRRGLYIPSIANYCIKIYILLLLFAYILI